MIEVSSITRVYHIDHNQVIDLMQHRDQLVADGPGLKYRNVFGEIVLFEGIDEMDAETIVLEEQIADTED